MTTSKIILVVLLATLHFTNAGHPSDDDFECSKSGRFADENDSTCKRYHVCSVGNGGQWVETSYECPDHTIFDKKVGHCSSSAKCRADSSESSDSSSDYDGDEFECKHPGLHDDNRDPTCSKYYECEQSHHGLFAVQYSCPPPSKFNPHQKQCSKHYICPRQFSCTRVGRFEDANDDNNKRYFLCVKKKNGDFAQALYSCPLYSRFDAIDSICVIPDDSISNEDSVHDHSLPNETWDHLDSFKCTKRGFFENKRDDNCRAFYYCDVNSDGTLAKYVLACPYTYGWNGITNLCTLDHSC